MCDSYKWDGVNTPYVYLFRDPYCRGSYHRQDIPTNQYSIRYDNLDYSPVKHLTSSIYVPPQYELSVYDHPHQNRDRTGWVHHIGSDRNRTGDLFVYDLTKDKIPDNDIASILVTWRGDLSNGPSSNRWFNYRWRCCTGKNSRGNCGQYTPGGSLCNDLMRSNCGVNGLRDKSECRDYYLEHPQNNFYGHVYDYCKNREYDDAKPDFCSCVTSPLSKDMKLGLNPICYDRNCLNPQAFKTPDQKAQQCPDVVYVDCKQQQLLDEGGQNNIITGNAQYQECNVQTGSNETESDKIDDLNPKPYDPNQTMPDEPLLSSTMLLIILFILVILLLTVIALFIRARLNKTKSRNM